MSFSSPSLRALRRGAIFVLLVLLAAPLAWAEGGVVEPSQMPGPLGEVRYDQNLGALLPLDVSFRDEAGRDVQLGELFGERPVVLSFVYYECPMLCSLTLQGIAKSLGVLKFDVGREFDVVVVSIDPGETPALAAEAKAETLDRYDRPETSDGWHFLTGSPEAIERLAETAGFHYVYDPETDEYAHASGIIIATSEGKIAQYQYGLEYSPKDVRLALVEASEEKIGSMIDQVLLYCFRYDPQMGKYTPITMRILRITAAVFLIALVALIVILLRLERTPRNAHLRSGAA